MSTSQNDIENAAAWAVRETLRAIGIDPADPLDARRDLAIMHEVGCLATDPEFRKDLEHMRRWRLVMEATQSRGFLTTVCLVLTGTAVALFVGLQSMLGRH